jgi:hypothetical protein
MSWEKTVADKITGVFSIAKDDVQKIETLVSGEVKSAFDKAHNDAVVANQLVNKIKADLQEALTKAAQLHQTAIDAANAAKAAAEADVAKYKAMVDAHSADLATQQSQIITPPPAPVVEAPVETPADPAQ